MRMLRNLAFGGPSPAGAARAVRCCSPSRSLADAITKDADGSPTILFSGFSIMAVTMPAVFGVGCTWRSNANAG